MLAGIGCSVLLDIDVEQSHYFFSSYEQEESRVLKITVKMTALLALGLVVEVFMILVRCTGRSSALNRISAKMRSYLPLYSWKYFYCAYLLKKGQSLNVETFIAWLKKNSDAVKKRGVGSRLALHWALENNVSSAQTNTHPHTRRYSTSRCCFRYIWKTLT